MKNIKPTLFLALLFVAFSCSDTEVVTNEKPIIQNNEPVVVNKFTKHVLIEDYTGTWCGFCTRVAQAIERVNLETDKAVVVAVHHGNDPYHFNGIEPLRAMILPETPDFPLPVSRLNRNIVWQFPENNNIQQVVNLTGSNCGLGIAMNSTVSSGTIELDVKIKFAENYSNLRLVVYALEDGLVYNQTNYTSSYQGGTNPIPNYEHNHVLRSSLTDILGELLPNTLLTGETVIRNFTIPVPANVSNAENLSFVAFVVDSNDTAINSRAAHANENQEFEENE